MSGSINRIFPCTISRIQNLNFRFTMFSTKRQGHVTLSPPIETRIAAAFIVSGGRLISRIQHRTFAGNNISNVDHVTVRHPSSNIRDTQPAARKLTETSFNFTPLIQYLARVNTDAHIKAVV